MRILIGFEESQIVCKAFRKLGHQAFSCDLKPCSGGHPEWHYQQDIFTTLILHEFDIIGLHPPCTKITLSGNRHYAPGKPRHNERIESVEWTLGLWRYATTICDHVYMENPIGALNGYPILPKPQIIHPYYFGDEATKTTCLWLHGLPKLYHSKEVDLFESKVTHVGKGERTVFASGKSHPKWYADAFKLNPEERSEVRSKTFPGIAAAMANQWSNLNTPTP